MLLKRLVYFTIAFSTFVTPFASQARVDGKVSILDLGVTQFGVGDIEIEYRKEKLARKLGIVKSDLINFLKKNPRKLKKILKDKPVKVVLGPHRQLYLIDHHHWLRLLFQLEVREVYFELQKNADFSQMNHEQFFEKLKSLELIYNFDEDKVELDPNGLIGRTIADMQNYNWRGLVGLVRDAGGIKKVDEPFFELKWWVTATKVWITNHYGQPDFNTAEGINLAVKHGLEFSATDEAQKLPGHVKPCDIVLRD